ncbi:hypothetical protein [Pseudonocardia cypriaca]|uniref:O-antigen/teichoic acid export membrane protein n=1 Tax=Pseudonocardia cypriaca TaxID=882449 RepID=A0A543GHR9_9PSEU|nr:hypothetical protein [Pseudonocardia cypriaca]TQM45630.1 hypothetical protein FB388_3030 [Pseudonocardia cypriaca]
MAGRGVVSRRQSTSTAPTAPGNVVMQQAIVRPDHFGRTHPDPRDDPPTVVLDPSRAPTEELQQVGPDTHRIPTVGVQPAPRLGSADPDRADPDSDADTDGIPLVGPPDGGADPDGRFLALSTLVGAVAALAGWLAAAHLVPSAGIGDAQLVVSLFLLVGGLAPMTMRLVRSRPPGHLAWLALPLVVPLSAVVGLGCVVLVPRFGAAAGGPGVAPIVGLLLVALGCAGWAVLSAHDIVLAAARKPRWAVWRTALLAPVQVGTLVVLCGTAALGAHGVVLSWLAAIGVGVVLGVAAVPVLARRAPAPAGDGPSPIPAAISLVGTALLYHLVPIVVTVRFGAETGAAFFVAWQVFVVVDLAAGYPLHALSDAVAREPGRTAELVTRARRRLLIVFLPVIALGAALAGPLLTAVGPAYAEAGDLLRLLLLGLAFRLVVTHELGVRQALVGGVGFDRLQLFSAVLVLVVAIALPVTAAGVSELRLAAIGYIIVQVACAAAVLVIPAARRTDVEVRAP